MPYAVMGVMAVLLLTLSVSSTFGAVPTPLVTGPIPATASPNDPSHNYP
jgi:hypothetical protein